MEPAIFVTVLIAIPTVIALCVNAAIALLVWRPFPFAVSHGARVLIGTVIPVLMAAYGQYLAWPWPWWRPELLTDGIKPGPLLILAGLPSWPLCLLVSRSILRRR